MLWYVGAVGHWWLAQCASLHGIEGRHVKEHYVQEPKEGCNSSLSYSEFP